MSSQSPPESPSRATANAVSPSPEVVVAEAATATAPGRPVVAPSTEAIAEAAARRFQQLQSEQDRPATAAQLLQLHEKRQKFRRMIDPGIMRPNAKEQATSSLKTLLAIAKNLLREPDNPKYQRFKPTNNAIKRELVERRGALEYAIELGFRPQVEDFQPYYVWHKRHQDDLEVGAVILKEFLTLHHSKDEQAEIAKKSERAVAASVHDKVKLAFMDDRRTKLQRDEMEKQVREAREARKAAGLPEISPAVGSHIRAHTSRGRPGSVDIESMGEGRTLGGSPPPAGDSSMEDAPAPPSYAG